VIPAVRVEAQVLARQFRFETVQMQALLRGPVMKNLTQRAIRVEAAAKRNATNRPGPKVRTGRLRASIGWRPGADSKSPYVDIGSSVHYAPFVEEGHGNTPHVFPILTPGGKFTGQFGYVSSKRTQPYPFLRPALVAARSI
jgi:hypothetical protein